MKQITIITGVCFLFLACNSQQKQTSTSQTQTSEIQLAEEQRQNSLEQARLDSLALIAWGDAKFGMSPKDVENTIAFSGKGNKVDDWSIIVPFEKRLEFERQNNLQELKSISGHFSENELYEIVLKSLTRSAAYLDDLISDCYILASKFEEKYGRPVMFEEDVSISSFANGVHQINLAVFSIAIEKGIVISIYEDDFEYYYEARIFNSAYPSKKHEPTPEEITQKQEMEQLRNNVKNNSF